MLIIVVFVSAFSYIASYLRLVFRYHSPVRSCRSWVVEYVELRVLGTGLYSVFVLGIIILA